MIYFVLVVTLVVALLLVLTFCHHQDEHTHHYGAIATGGILVALFIAEILFLINL